MKAFGPLLLALAGCASQVMLASDFNDLQRDVQQAHLRQNCAPAELAIADANFEFVKLEFQQGDTRRAAEHLAIAREHVHAALACPVPEGEVIPTTVPTPTDRDGDGISDADDACPTDAEDLDGFRDVDGCAETDNDEDGVPDGSDTCRDQAEDKDTFQDADGCPEFDNDEDGMPDDKDACPNEPGSPVDDGCALHDTDHDLVADGVDACPDVAETMNGYADQDGCPDTKPGRVEITSTQIVITQRVNFATGKADILADSFPVLDDVAQVMRDYPRIAVEIGGHTDSTGDESANQRLSKARADAVFEYLLTKGIPGNRMTTVGYGEMAPVDTNSTTTGRLANRRVEFKITAQ